jgi:hypothetical protein
VLVICFSLFPNAGHHPRQRLRHQVQPQADQGQDHRLLLARHDPGGLEGEKFRGQFLKTGFRAYVKKLPLA